MEGERTQKASRRETSRLDELLGVTWCTKKAGVIWLWLSRASSPFKQDADSVTWLEPSMPEAEHDCFLAALAFFPGPVSFQPAGLQNEGDQRSTYKPVLTLAYTSFDGKFCLFM